MFSKELFRYAILIRREEIAKIEAKLQGMLVLGEDLSNYVLVYHTKNGTPIRTEILHKTDPRLEA